MLSVISKLFVWSSFIAEMTAAFAIRCRSISVRSSISLYLLVSLFAPQLAQDILFRTVDDTLGIGSPCKFRHNDTMGICVQLLLCPGAQREMQYWQITPTTCSFVSNDNPIVCCMGSTDVRPPFPVFPAPGAGFSNLPKAHRYRRRVTGEQQKFSLSLNKLWLWINVALLCLQVAGMQTVPLANWWFIDGTERTQLAHNIIHVKPIRNKQINQKNSHILMIITHIFSHQWRIHKQHICARVGNDWKSGYGIA